MTTFNMVKEQWRRSFRTTSNNNIKHTRLDLRWDYSTNKTNKTNDKYKTRQKHLRWDYSTNKTNKKLINTKQDKNSIN